MKSVGELRIMDSFLGKCLFESIGCVGAAAYSSSSSPRLSAVSGSIAGVAKTDRGWLLDTTEPIYASVIGAKLTLMNAVSDEPVETQISSDTGRFEFHAVPAGLYPLCGETPVSHPPCWGYPSDGYVPIELDPRSKFGALDMIIDDAICGELAWGRRGETDSPHAQTH